MARIIDQIVGHGIPLDRLNGAIERGRLASTLLFVGPQGIGKKLVGLAVAQKLICEKSTSCGVCAPCIRVQNGQSENLKVVTPSQRNLKIDQARDVIKFISLQNVGRSRVVIIDDAHYLNPQAANALLKSLEEPPKGTYFILIASGVSGLLPTIRSRSQIVRFGALDKIELKRVIAAEDWILQSSQGSLAFAEQLQTGGIGEIRGRAIEVWNSLLDGQLHGALDVVRNFVKDREGSLHVARLWHQVLRDAWFVSENVEGVIHQDYFYVIKRVAGLNKSKLAWLAQGALRLEREIEGNGDRNLLFENYLYEAQHVIA